MEQRALSAKEFFEMGELKKEFVPLDDNGGGIWIQELDGAKYDEYIAYYSNQSAKARDASSDAAAASYLSKMRARLIAFSAITPEGEPLFPVDDDHVDAIAAMPASLLNRLWAVANRLSGFDAEVVKKT